MKKSLIFKIAFAVIVILSLIIFFNSLSKKSIDQINLKKNGESLNSSLTYDNKKADKIITQYARENIISDLLPSRLEIKQGLSIDGRQEDIKNQYGSIFTKNGDSFSISFHFVADSNKPNDFSIFITPKEKVESASSAIANSVLSKYFIKPYSVSDCKTKGSISYCENFKITDNGKRGYGVVVSNPNFIVFSCFIPVESKDYSNIESCIRL